MTKRMFWMKIKINFVDFFKRITSVAEMARSLFDPIGENAIVVVQLDVYNKNHFRRKLKDFCRVALRRFFCGVDFAGFTWSIRESLYSEDEG
jgi:hypothetical protein